MKYLLIFSLGLNLLVAGWVVGSKIAGHGQKAHMQTSSGPMRVMLRALPQNKRTEVRRYFRENRKDIQAERKNLQNAFAQIEAAIAARPFDPEVLHSVFDMQRQHFTTVTQYAQIALIQAVTDMTDAERADYLENIKDHRKRHQKKRGKKKDIE